MMILDDICMCVFAYSIVCICKCIHTRTLLNGIVWYGMVWYWYGMVWYDMVWYGMVLCGMASYGMLLSGSANSTHVWFLGAHHTYIYIYIYTYIYIYIYIYDITVSIQVYITYSRYTATVFLTLEGTAQALNSRPRVSSSPSVGSPEPPHIPLADVPARWSGWEMDQGSGVPWSSNLKITLENIWCGLATCGCRVLCAWSISWKTSQVDKDSASATELVIKMRPLLCPAVSVKDVFRPAKVKGRVYPWSNFNRLRSCVWSVPWNLEFQNESTSSNC